MVIESGKLKGDIIVNDLHHVNFTPPKPPVKKGFTRRIREVPFLYAGCYIPRSKSTSVAIEKVENVVDIETCQRICQTSRRCLAAAFSRDFLVRTSQPIADIRIEISPDTPM